MSKVSFGVHRQFCHRCALKEVVSIPFSISVLFLFFFCSFSLFFFNPLSLFAGRIINVSSLVGVYASPFSALYASTKFALEVLLSMFRCLSVVDLLLQGLTQGFSGEVIPFGIHAIVVQPGFTKVIQKVPFLKTCSSKPTSDE